MASKPEDLEQWLDEVSVAYHLMDDFVPDDVVLDHSAESLELLGDVLHDYDEVPGFDDAEAAYVGQTLLMLAGGCWGWDDAPDSVTFGQPLACPSEELGLTSVAPVELVNSGSAAIVEKYAEWEQKVVEYAAMHPDWRPSKEFTPGLDRPERIADEDRLSAWLAEREQGFPQWVAAYGEGCTWDFSPATLNALAAALFRVTPTVERFNDPSNTAFVDGATWYFGETLRRAEPGEWIAQRITPDSPEEHFCVQKHPDDWSPAPKLNLWGAVHYGNPVRLHDTFERWTAPPATKGWPEPEYQWDGTAWHTALDTWVESVAERIDTLAAAVPHITLDYSAESLRLLEAFCRAAGPDLEQGLVENIAAYVGEALLRVQGGCWSWHDAPRSGSLGRPKVSVLDQISPIDLVLVACRWSDPGALTHSYEACERTVTRNQATKNPKTPTPGLDPAPAPTPIESWCAAREHDFPAWTARYGAGRTWDFSRDSLVDLADVVLTVVPTVNQFRDPQHTAFLDGAAWYYGEVLRRGKPSEWDYRLDCGHPDRRDADGLILDVATLERERVYPLSVFVVQDLRYLVEGPLLDGRNVWPPDLIGRRRFELRRRFDSWVTAVFRQRTEDALRRRNRKKSRRKQSDTDYAAAWTTAQAQRFPEWQKHCGAEFDCDFSPESLDGLESMIRQVTPTPEDLLENPQNAEFVNVAAWYFGETVRRATDLVWTYIRDEGPDCYLHDGTYGRVVHPIDVFAKIFSHYDPGSLRQNYNYWIS